jgi:hypothetical protein
LNESLKLFPAIKSSKYYQKKHILVTKKQQFNIGLGKRKGKSKAELTYKGKDGFTFQGETTAGYFTDADGVRKASLIIRDITQA